METKISATLRRLRIRAGLTQSQAAKSIGVQQTSVTQWEAGTTSPRPCRLRKIADTYGCNVETLIDCLEEGENP